MKAAWAGVGRRTREGVNCLLPGLPRRSMDRTRGGLGGGGRGQGWHLASSEAPQTEGGAVLGSRDPGGKSALRGGPQIQCFVCVFLGPHLQHMEVPRLGVELEH